MTAGDGWRSAPLGRAVLVVVDAGPRPLEAVLTPAELDRLRPVLDATAVAARDGGFSRIRLRDAARDAIGRDPFHQTGPDDDGVGWWPALMIFFGLFGVLDTDRPLWVRLLAGVLLVYAGTQLFQQFRRLRRRRAARGAR